ncbi:MAG: TauD/TfdA family dioxygenase [Bryobacterales bacterium]|nr:TauD/TfdA family dioxygenase [Bryobacterales bacterium]
MNWADVESGFRTRGWTVFRTGCTDLWIAEVIAAKIGRAHDGVFEKAIDVVSFDPGRSLVTRSIASSSSAMSPHTDGSFEPFPPTDLLFQCIEADESPHGLSTIVTLSSIIQVMSAPHLRALSEPNFFFNRDESGRTSEVRASVISASGGVRYRSDPKYRICCDEPCGQEALAELERILQAGSLEERIVLEVGDIMWLNNTSVLHGRTALSGRSSRVIRRLRLYAPDPLPPEH